jgi:hypothetical protein
MSLLYQIETCLRLTRLPPSRFGRDAVRDPRIVHDLRRGRQPGERMERRLRSYIRQLLDTPAGMPGHAGPGDALPGVAEAAVGYRAEAGAGVASDRGNGRPGDAGPGGRS